MAVIRVKHEKNYVVLQKEILENPSISLKAKGLWAFCMAKPDHWEFHITQLSETLKEGKEALRTGINELIKFGYAVKIQPKKENGRWDEVDYEIFETSQLKKCLPQTGFPLPEDPLPENPPLVSIKNSSYEEFSKDQQQQREQADADENISFNSKISESDLDYTHPNGTKMQISASVIFRAMVPLGYTSEAILRALEKARRAKMIRDPIEYIKTIASESKEVKESLPLQKSGILSQTLPPKKENGGFKWVIKKLQSQEQNSTKSETAIETPALQN